MWVRRLGILLLSAVLGGLFLVLGPVGKSAGYVMPSEQILEYMSKHVLGFETLGLVLEFARDQDEGEEEAPVSKRVWFRPPDSVRVQPGGGREQGVFPWLESGVLSLFSGNTGEAERTLSRMGVGIGRSAYDRLEKTVAYRIGSAPGDGPFLLVEKRSFLPLLLEFEPPGARIGERARVRFRNYQKIGDGWFPYEFVCQAASGVTRIYTVRAVSANASARSWLSVSPEGKARENDRGEGASGRRERVLESFEKKYGSSTP